MTKKEWQASNSYLAQGGIAAAYAPDDDWHQQLEDALRAGRYHNDVAETAFLARESKQQVDELIQMGMHFDRDQKGKILLAREGGHSAARVLHAHGDATGRELTAFVKKYVERQITIHEHTQATDLLVQNGRCIGIRAIDQSGEPVIYYAQNTVLATGGCGQIYAPTSADPAVTGDGLALAYRAGAALKDMEFVQFHPTLLIKNHRVYGLVSEAVRGEGAKLINQDGERLLAGRHPLEDLAPRDVVARVLFKAKKTGAARQIYLDVSMIDRFAERFPTITGLCRQADVDLQKGWIPVSPGAHFLMGGIETDHEGRTTLPGLYAVGECACTGVHGANRIASHSLLEAITYAGTAAAGMSGQTERSFKKIAAESVHRTLPPLPAKEEIQKMMFEDVGIWRTRQSLVAAVDWCLSWKVDFSRGERFDGTKDELERLNMLTTAWLIASSALKRTESRGGHTRIDYPEEIEHWRTKSIIREVDKNEQN